MTDPAPIVQAVAEALEVHQIEFIDWQVGWDCGCNEHGYLPGMPALTDALRHQAEVAVAAARPLIIEDFLTHHHRPTVTIDNAEQVKGFMAEAIREAKAEALIDFADSTRFPSDWILFRRDDGSGVTVSDLLRETAANYREQEGQ